MPPKYKFKLNRGRKPTKDRSKAGTAVDQKITEARNREIDEAVKYCQEHNVNGYAALKTNLFPNIQDRGIIDRRLKGKVKHGRERDYCRILTVDEENMLVEYIKNKNRAYQSMNKLAVSQLILNILRIRQHLNKNLNYKNCTPLSTNAKKVLAEGKLGRRFWTRFLAAHKDLGIKRKGNVSINRALNCTRSMAMKHIDDLAAELIKAGIFRDATMEKTGVWTGDIDTSRIFNHDETPQFIQYGVDGTPSGLFFAGKGEACQKMIKENRECVTIQPFVSFAGEMAMCQVIFAGKSITSNLVPDGICDKIEHLLISMTENGVQTSTSLLAAYQLFDKYLEEKGVERPVVLISDGHSSRFDFDVLKFLEEANILLFLSPPDTTGLLQLLDQINQMLHRCYKNCKENMFTPLSSVNREGFMLILAEMWNMWASEKSIVNAAKRVGVTPKELSIEFMQQEKFEKAERVMQTEEKEAPITFSPKCRRKNSFLYQKEKCENLEKELKRRTGAGLNLDEVDGLFKFDKVTKKPKLSSEKIRVTQVCGSMEANKVKEVVLELRQKKESAEAKKMEKSREKKESKDAFIRCKTECVCEKDVCGAIGFKQCPNCQNVLRSICAKAVCQVDGKKPKMILPVGTTTVVRKKTKAMGKTLKPFAESGTESSEEESDYNELWIEDEEFVDEISEHSTSVQHIDEVGEESTSAQKIDIDDVDIGMYYAVKCMKPCGYRWGKLVLVFSEDPDSDVDSAKFSFLKKKKMRTHRIQDMRYEWPKNPEEEIVSIGRVFFGPVYPTVEQPSYKFDCDNEVNDLYKMM